MTVIMAYLPQVANRTREGVLRPRCLLAYVVAMTTTQPWLELEEIRRRDGWDLTELAEASGVCRESLRLYAKGQRSPRPKTIQKLATAMKVPYSVLAPSPRDGDNDHAVVSTGATAKAVTA